MIVATQPYGDSDFEYPEIILQPFKASNVSIIPQSEALKKWEEEEAQAKEALENEKQAEMVIPEPPKVKPNAVKPDTIKPDSIKPAEILQQTLTPILKKERETIMKHYLESAESVFQEVKSNENGLSSNEAAARLEKNGKNKSKITETSKRPKTISLRWVSVFFVSLSAILRSSSPDNNSSTVTENNFAIFFYKIFYCTDSNTFSLSRKE